MLPRPACGERVGVRGSLRKGGVSWTRGESPSPEFDLRSNLTSPRKRGEVKRSSQRLQILDQIVALRVVLEHAADHAGAFRFAFLALEGMAEHAVALDRILLRPR